MKVGNHNALSGDTAPGRTRSSIDGECIGWAGGMGLRVGSININDMYNNDGDQGGPRVCEAHEVK